MSRSGGEPSPTVPTERQWYGWQTFSSDGVAAGLFAGGLAAQSNASLLAAGGAVFVLGAPVLHAAHGQWSLAAASLGLRVVTPAIGAALGNHYDTCPPSEFSGSSSNGGCSGKWGTAGIVIGALIASAIDGSLLAYEPVPEKHSNQLLGYVPGFVPIRHGFALTWSGSL